MIHARIKKIFAEIDTTGFGHTQASYYYTKRIKLRRKFVKMSAISDMKEQLIYAIKIRHRQDMTVWILCHCYTRQTTFVPSVP